MSIGFFILPLCTDWRPHKIAIAANDRSLDAIEWTEVS
jgi:hypothetical protein